MKPTGRILLSFLAGLMIITLGNSQPVITINPPALTVNGTCNDTVNVPLTIYNNGSGNLDFQVTGLLDSIVYYESFTQGATPVAQATSWVTFRSQLVPRQYIALKVSGSINPVGITLTDTAVISDIANALSNSLTYTDTVGMDIWYVGTGCGPGVVLSVNTTICVCDAASPNIYVVRPEINNNNWGGINTATCNGPTQTLRVVFYYGTSAGWLVPTVTNGTVAPGDSSIVNIIFDAAGLFAGQYNSQIVFSSNDPLNPFDTVPCTFNVTGIPSMEITLSDVSGTCLDFDTVLENQTGAASMAIINAGCDTLMIDSIVVTPVQYTLTTSVSYVPPYDTVTAAFTFIDSVAGTVNGTVYIYSNDYDTSICLSGVVAPAPAICFSPDTVSATLVCGDSVTVPFIICNSGGSNLNWNATVGASISDDFDPGINSSIWSSTNGLANVNCGSVSGNALWFGDNAAREATTIDLNTTGGGTISFYLEIGTTTGNCEDADTGEEVYLEYSVNGGSTWTNIATFGVDLYPTFSLLNITIPSGAQTSSTRFRWSQPFHSGSCCDHWAIDNVSVDVAGNCTNFLCFSPVTGTTPAGGNDTVYFTFNSSGFLAGQYLNMVTITTNDPLNDTVMLPCILTVTGSPLMTITLYDVSGVCLDFDTVLENQAGSDSVAIINYGCDTLVINSISVTPSQYTLAASVSFVPPYDTVTVVIDFIDTAIGTINGSLNLYTNDYDTSICLLGVVAPAPEICYSPDTLIATIACSDSLTMTLTICNTGGTNLNYALSGGCNPEPVLDSVLNRLNSQYANLTGLIPNMYLFSDGVTGNNIPDGGNDMYDGGNYLNTDLGLQLNYSDNLVTLNAAMGTGGRYFTRKFNGLFVFAADINNVTYFEITGNNGADGSGNYDGAILTATACNISFRGFVKRVYNASDPSINHLIIVEDKPGITHTYSTNTNDDQHRVTGLNASTRIYYLLYASATGGYVSDSQTQAIFDEFLNIITPGSSWISVTPTSGSVSALGSDTISVMFDASGLMAGQYFSDITITSNDPLFPVITVPCTLNVTGIPNMGITIFDSSGSCIDFDTVMENQTGVDSVAITNTGCDTLFIDSINVTPVQYTLTASVAFIPPYDTETVILNFVDNTTGSVSGTLGLFTNDYDTVICLQGTVVPAPVISFNPDSINVTIACCDSVFDTLAIYNTGGYPLIFDLPNIGGLPNPIRDFLIIDHSKGKTSFSSYTTQTTTEAAFAGMTLTQLMDNRVIYFEPDWTNYNNLTGNMGNLANYVSQGGVVVINIAGNIGDGTNVDPYGTDYSRATLHDAEIISLPAHPYITGIPYGGNTLVTTNFDNWNNTDHGTLSNYPPGTEVVLTNVNGTSWIHYPFGNGHVIVTTLTYRWGGSPDNACDNLVDYARYLANNSGVSWLTATPVNDTVAAGDSSFIQVGFNSCGLFAGTYTAGIIINSNDPVNPVDTLPVSMTVAGNPFMGITAFDLSGSCVDFDTVMENQTGVDSVVITNTGCDTLFINSINVTPVQYTLTASATLIPPYDTATVIISFVDTTTGTVSGTLNLFTNDFDTAICLLGVVAPAPVICYSPDSIIETVNCGDSVTIPLTICNSGGSNLNYSIDGTGFGIVGDSSVLVIQETDAWGVLMVNFLQTNYGIIPDVISSAQIPATNFMQYDIIITVGDESTTYYDNISNNVAKFETFVNAGGILQYQMATQGATGINLVNGAVLMYGNAENQNTGLIPSHPLLAGIANPLTGNWANHSYLTNLPAGTQVITQTTSSMVPTTIEYTFGQGLVIATGMTWEYLYSNIGTYPSGQMLPNSINYILSVLNTLPSWLTLSSNSGVVIPGDTNVVNVTLNSLGLFAGTYTTDLIIMSNDPVNGTVTIPVVFTVSGVQELSISVPDLSGTCLDFDTVPKFGTGTDSIIVSNTGCDSLTIDNVSVSPASFSVVSYPSVLLPGESGVIIIQFSPVTTGSFSGNVNLFTNDIDTAICLSGFSYPGPEMVVVPDSFNVNLSCEDSITFTFDIINNGAMNLTWNTSVLSSVSDDFDPGYDVSLWAYTNGVPGASCGSVSGNALYFDATGTREARTYDMNATGGGNIYFYLKIGNGVSPCEDADVGEEPRLEYSTDFGATWTIINTYGVDLYPSFALVTEAIPVAAQTANTRFRWSQPFNSGSGFDNWAIDDVSIGAANMNLSLTPPSGITPSADTTTVTVVLSKTGMSQGTYTLNITINSNDPGNPVFVIPVVVTIDSLPPVLVSLGSKTNVTCYGGNNGAININVTGGCTPYTYTWSNGAFTEDISGLNAGIYSVTVTDKNGTTVPFATAITQPTQLTPTITGTTAAGCTTCNGTATVTTSGGVTPYTYLWDPVTGSQTSTLATGLCAGSYYVTVTDNKGCTSSAIASISGAGGLSSNIAPFSNMSCNGMCDGSASVLVFGGTSPYAYSWNTGSTSSSISSLCPGNYALTVTDNNGCISVSNITLTEPATLAAALTGLNASCSICGDGAVDLLPSGGTPPYTYQWSNGSVTQDINNLLPGTYTVTLADAEGCTATDSVFVDFTTGYITAAGEPGVSVYPNPASGLFYIQLNHAWGADSEFNLFTAQGRLMERRLLKPGKTLFHTGDLVPGLYLIRISGRNKSETFRINIIR